LHYDRSANWNELRAMVLARYRFGAEAPALPQVP
jgi:hypothetical protein